MARYRRCFLSSTFEDLKEERLIAIDAIDRSGYKPIAMEAFATDSRAPAELLDQLVRTSDVVILIIANRFGSKESKSGKYFVQIEYETAIREGIPVQVFLSSPERLVAEAQSRPKRGEISALSKFRADLMLNHITSEWTDVENLRTKILISLAQFRKIRGIRNPKPPRKRDKSGTLESVSPASPSPHTLASPLSPIPDFSKIVDWYAINFAAFERIRNRIEREIQAILVALVETHEVVDYTVYSRTKSASSLGAKLERPKPGVKFDSIADVGDLIGIRVVVFHESEVELVTRRLQERLPTSTLEIKEPDSPSAFGYRSHHLETPLNDIIDGIDGFKFEIQVRTHLQHAWAQIEHRLGYKASTYDELSRRIFAQVSALLEIADGKFSELKSRQEKHLANSPPEDGVRSKADEVFVSDGIPEFRDSAGAIEAYFLGDDWDASPLLKAILSSGFAFSVDLSTNRSRSSDLANVCAILAIAGIKDINKLQKYTSQNSSRLLLILQGLSQVVEFAHVSPLLVLWIVALAAKAEKIDTRPRAEIRGLLDEYNLFVKEERDEIADLFVI
jgi:ppGpp synthetase/RelA/SpoT-type nucleotidyltranferase